MRRQFILPVGKFSQKIPKQPKEIQMIPKYTLAMRVALINTSTSTDK